MCTITGSEGACRTRQSNAARSFSQRDAALGINDIEAANAYLPTYLDDHNNRFAVEAKSNEDAHRKDLPTAEEMNLIFSYQEGRTLSKNLELSYENLIYQIKINTKGYRLRHSMVTVCKDLNDVITLVCLGNSKLPSYIRNHWSIESEYHWELDVHLHDDDDKKHNEVAAINFAKTKRLLLSLVKSKLPPGKKKSVRSRLKRVGWDLDYLLALLLL